MDLNGHQSEEYNMAINSAKSTANAQGWIRIGITVAVLGAGILASHVRMEVLQSSDKKLQEQKDKSQDDAIKRIDELGSKQLNDYSSSLKTLENDVKHLATSFNEFKSDTKAWQERVESFLYQVNKPKLE